MKEKLRITMECPKCGNNIKVYSNPLPTVDIIIKLGKGIVLIERKNQPLGWALPGGFVDLGESLEEAARREAKEETGLEISQLKQFHTYSAPDRDPRFHTITTVYTAKAEGSPRAGDDAGKAQVFPWDNLPDLVFDHADIIRDYLDMSEEFL